MHRLNEEQGEGADEAVLTRFLLGELPDEERLRLEDACFEDEALFARLLRAEDDLIDAYARGVARLLLRESWKEAAREEQARAQMPRVFEEDDAAERQQACLDHCLETLTPRNREIILGYYAGERRAKIELRRELAARLGTELNALHVRAHRIRALLEECVWKCIG